MRKSAILATVAVLALAGCGNGSMDEASADQIAADDQAAAAEDVLHEQVAAEKSAETQSESDPAYAYKAIECAFLLSMIHATISQAGPSPDLDTAKKAMDDATNVAIGLSLKYGISPSQGLQQSTLKAKYDNFAAQKNAGQMTDEQIIESIMSDLQRYCNEILTNRALIEDAMTYYRN
jgi:hypothetical protein